MVVHFHEPENLTGLFRVFDELETGVTVVLRHRDDPGSSLVGSSPPFAPAAGPFLGFRSSGSTGPSKLIWRRWQELRSDIRTDPRISGWIWASSFEPATFAGVHVALVAWRNQMRLLPLDKDLAANWRKLGQLQPAALSCTPTFLDLMLQFEEPTGWTPRQITLGGEILHARSGARFRARFPETRFTVIYASAEQGVILKTNRLDGWYPVSAREPSGKPMRVIDGVLEMERDGTWSSTRDRVEVRGEWLRLLGRVDAVANVGGTKVNLDEVSALAEEVPGIRRASAFVRSSPVVGEVIGLRFALENGAAIQAVQPALEFHLRKHLKKEAWPRDWVLDEVGLGKNSKRVCGDDAGKS